MKQQTNGGDVKAITYDATRIVNAERIRRQAIEGLAAFKARTERMSAFEYLYLTEQWSTDDFAFILAYCANNDCSLTQAEA
jgi:hypothetical protein